MRIHSSLFLLCIFFAGCMHSHEKILLSESNITVVENNVLRINPHSYIPKKISIDDKEFNNILGFSPYYYRMSGGIIVFLTGKYPSTTNDSKLIFYFTKEKQIKSIELKPCAITWIPHENYELRSSGRDYIITVKTSVTEDVNYYYFSTDSYNIYNSNQIIQDELIESSGFVIRKSDFKCIQVKYFDRKLGWKHSNTASDVVRFIY